MIVDKEFESLIPPLTDDEYKQLEKNCIDYGIKDALVVGYFPGALGVTLLDGHNRYRISQKNNLAYTETRLDFPSREKAVEWIILNQLGRRNLSPVAIIDLCDEKLRPLLKKQASERMNSGVNNPIQTFGQGTVNAQIAKIANVSDETVRKYEVVKKKADEETKEKVKTGELSINQAYRQVVPKPKDTSVIDAQKKHDEFKQNDASVISIAEIKDDKANMDILARDFFLKTMKALDQFENIDFFKTDEERRELANALSSENKNILAARLARATNKIHYLKELIGGNKC